MYIPLVRCGDSSCRAQIVKQIVTRTRHSGKPRSTHPGRPRGGPSVVSRLGGRSAAEEKASERPARCIRRPEKSGDRTPHVIGHTCSHAGKRGPGAWYS